jgi:hypothetical protein
LSKRIGSQAGSDLVESIFIDVKSIHPPYSVFPDIYRYISKVVKITINKLNPIPQEIYCIIKIV